MTRTLVPLAVAGCVLLTTARPAPTQPRHFSLVEATIPEIVAALETHRINSKQLVKLYLDRIAAYEGTLNALITINPEATAVAHQRDVERAHGDIRGPLHGVPIVLKDNVHTLDMITTGGALAFTGLRVPYESTLSQKLRDAGAVILGKTVLTELANWVSDHMPANYSAVGGYGMNPYDPRPDPRHIIVNGHHFADDGRPVMSTGGSSSGIATSANLAVANVGTETSGSILSPSNQTMLAGIKPTVGLISRYGVIPITADQDTAGPMARDVASAAIMLGVLQGFDPHDPATAACLTPGNCHDDYTPFLQAGGLAGARIGVPQAGFYSTLTDAQRAVVDDAIAVIRASGATVEFTDIPSQVDGTLPAWGVCAAATQNKGNDCGLLGGAEIRVQARLQRMARLARRRERHRQPHGVDRVQPGARRPERDPLRAGPLRHLRGDGRRRRRGPLCGGSRPATSSSPRRTASTKSWPRADFDALLFGGASSAGLAARPGYPTVIVPFGFIPNDPR